MSILGKNKKRNGIILGVGALACAAIVGGVVTLNTGTELPEEEYDDLYKKYLQPLHISVIASKTWDDPGELPAHMFISYYGDECHRAGIALQPDTLMNKYEGLFPQEELEPYVQRHFDVSTEHLRTMENYYGEYGVYGFGGLGSAVDYHITSAVRKGNTLTLSYDVWGGPGTGYLFGDGAVKIEVRSDEDYKYVSNRYERSAESYLHFPPAIDVVSENGTMVMDSGDKYGRSADGENWMYNGEDIASIIWYYEDEALPALKAVGQADTGRYEDGWYWSGTYRNGTPLTIDVQRMFGGDTYIITASHKENAGAVSTPVGEIDLTKLDNLYSDYVADLFYCGVLDSSWSVPYNIDSSALVAYYACREELQEGELRFPADEVDDFLRHYFVDYTPNSIRNSICHDEATNTYTSDKNFTDTGTQGRAGKAVRDGENLILFYEIYLSEDKERVLWEGELGLKLMAEGYQYQYNIKQFPIYPVTQDEEYLQGITETYVSPILPHTLIKDWASPSEIPADELVEFCAYNNLLNKPVLYDNVGILRGAELAEQRGEAVEVEAEIQRYFGISAEYLHGSRWYNYTENGNADAYAGAYLLVNGTGGPAMARAFHVEIDGDLLRITAGVCGPEDEPDRPMQTSLLTIQVEADGSCDILPPPTLTLRGGGFLGSSAQQQNIYQANPVCPTVL